MNSKYSVIIRCVTNPESGFGHLRRCVILAKLLEKNKCTVDFIIDKNKNAKEILLQNNFSFFEIRKNNLESANLKNILERKKYDMIIFDLREKIQKVSKFLKESKILSVIIDDAWCKLVHSDLIINPTIIKKFQSYKKIKKTSKMFLGPKYFITNPSFLTHKKKSSSIVKKKRYKVVISMGGGDSTNLTSKILNKLKVLSDIQIIVILGPFFRNKKKLLKFRKNKNIEFLESPEYIWKIFQKSDLVICSAGSTLYELAIQKIPTICYPIVEHQFEYGKKFAKQGFSKNLGYWKERDSNLEEEVNKLLNEPKYRKKISRKGDKIIDGKGYFRVGKIILKELQHTN